MLLMVVGEGGTHTQTHVHCVVVVAAVADIITPIAQPLEIRLHFQLETAAAPCAVGYLYICVCVPLCVIAVFVVAHILAVPVFQACLFVFWPEQLSLGWSPINYTNKNNNTDNNTVRFGGEIAL